MPEKKKEIKKSIGLTQTIPVEERVECIERLIVFSFLALATLNTITKNQTNFFGINLIIFHLIVFFISFPTALYYSCKILIIFSWSLGESSGRLGVRIGESIGGYIQEHESKLKKPFYLSLVLLAILIAHYILGRDFSEITYAVLLIVVGVIIKKYFDDKPKKTKRYYDDNPKKKKKKKLTTQNLILENKIDT